MTLVDKDPVKFVTEREPPEEFIKRLRTGRLCCCHENPRCRRDPGLGRPASSWDLPRTTAVYEIVTKGDKRDDNNRNATCRAERRELGYEGLAYPCRVDIEYRGNSSYDCEEDLLLSAAEYGLRLFE